MNKDNASFTKNQNIRIIDVIDYKFCYNFFVQKMPFKSFFILNRPLRAHLDLRTLIINQLINLKAQSINEEYVPRRGCRLKFKT